MLDQYKAALQLQLQGRRRVRLSARAFGECEAAFSLCGFAYAVVARVLNPYREREGGNLNF